MNNDTGAANENYGVNEGICYPKKREDPSEGFYFMRYVYVMWAKSPKQHPVVVYF